MNQLRNRLDKFWFSATSPASLAMLRIVVGGYAVLYLISRTSLLAKISNTDESLFAPVGLASLLDAPLTAPTFEAIVCLTILAGIAYVLGWGFRVSGPVFGVLLLFVFCYRNSWSMVYHSDNLLVLHVMIIGCARSAHALSLDAFVRGLMAKFCKRSDAQTFFGDRASSWHYGWPIQLMCSVTALTYFLAGVAKVAGPLGWSWAGGESMRAQVAVDLIRKELLGGETSPLAALLYDHLWLFAVLGVATLLLELGAPAAILSRRIARPWVIAAFAFHWGIFLVMGITFKYQLSGVVFACFIVRDFLTFKIFSNEQEGEAERVTADAAQSPPHSTEAPAPSFFH